MRRAVEKVMAHHGTDLTIVSGEENKTVRGFFRAVNSKSWQSMESEASLLGEITRDRTTEKVRKHWIRLNSMSRIASRKISQIRITLILMMGRNSGMVPMVL